MIKKGGDAHTNKTYKVSFIFSVFMISKEQKMNQIRSLISVIVILSFVLAGCAPKPAEAPAKPAETEAPAKPAKTEAPAEPAEKITLIDWAFTGEIQTKLFYEHAAKKLMAAHPNVEMEMLGGVTEDAISQIKAAHGVSPVDTISVGKVRFDQAQNEDLILPVPASDVPNAADIYPFFQDQCTPNGFAWKYQVLGVIYNPEIVSKPESWDDLWKPEYKGKIGIASPGANSGFLFLMLLAKLYGSGEEDLDAIWKKLDELQPFVVTGSPEQLTQLLENKEIGVAVTWVSDVALPISKGFNLKIAMPKPGGVALAACYIVLKNSAHPDLAKEYINIILSAEFQKQMSEPPWAFGPVNKNVTLSEASLEFLPTSEELEEMVAIDYKIAVPLRPELTDKFIREYGQ
jgi:putative spermidine/putrescine transport system substrate-binding protein